MIELKSEFENDAMSLEDLVHAMYDRGILAVQAELMTATFGAMAAAFESMGIDTIGSEGINAGGADLRLAIQKPGAAFALSFSAHKRGNAYVFLPTSELGDIRVRASDFTGKSAGIGSFGSSLGDLGLDDLFGNPDGTSSDGDSTQGGGGDSPTRPDVPTGPGPSSPGG